MSRRFRLPYGRDSYQELIVEEANFAGLLHHREAGPPLDEVGLRRAFASPVGTPPLRELVRKGDRVAIVTSDITRPCPSKVLLPLILEELQEAGIRREDIIIVLAVGNHRPHTEEEKRALLGEGVYAAYRCVDSDPADTVYVGTTSRGTPVEIFRPVVEADKRILLGNVEYHYFAGYSGGVKALLPGCATPRTIQANHRMMVEEGATAGEIDNNPVRRDIEEVNDFVHVDFIFNVVLDEAKNILAAFAGHPVLAHREACKYLDGIYKVKIAEPADIVVASAGGFPKDINLYQAQKAMDNASRAVRSGGILILVAECPEGLGDEVFSKWVAAAQKPEDLLDRVRVNFELGGHKAAAIAMVRRKIDIYLVSSLSPDIVRRVFLEPFTELQEAYRRALETMGAGARVMVIPQGGSLLPVVE
ncbi:nickel-dependent lactate racemase [Thermanaeromonas sp. C210]|uniref:nickel-dependent lactate racemase n=1 Tax=Thermanaeromonas sp. C210 TaxID=2731925 RepID=UPI00155D2A1C|nr:nickel-dependent lactate racemase [Thermanaeromonas sp. C210]GFN23152.1 transcriptional regulator [Thermanaeromonas sp. C210]